MKTIKVLCIGDVVGITGQIMFQKHLATLKKQYHADIVIVNGENSSGTQGRGITPKIVASLKHAGADVITTGNHIWYKRDIYPYLADRHQKDLLRPANFPPAAPGCGMTTLTYNNHTIGVMNLQGRIFMKEFVDCPFRAAASLITYLHSKTKIIIVDFHAEATAEKMALGFYLDGKVSVVFGTHTHVQTADNRVLPQGTAYISDVGMVGSYNSMIGMKKEPIIESFISQMPTKFSVDTSMPVALQGIVVSIDTESGKAESIERIQLFDDNLDIPDPTRESLL